MRVYSSLFSDDNKQFFADHFPGYPMNINGDSIDVDLSAGDDVWLSIDNEETFASGYKPGSLYLYFAGGIYRGVYQSTASFDDEVYVTFNGFE